MAFNVAGEPLGSKYLKDSDIIDNYIGNTLYGWGYNGDGQLATNDRTTRYTPTQEFTGGTTWKQISGRTYCNGGIKTDGTLWLWGSNYYGQLGFNGTGTRSSPVQTISGGTDWKLLSAGSYHTAAIKTNGSLWVWGSNTVGQLGTNNPTSVSSPVQTVAAGTNWKQVECAVYHTAAIKTDGTLWIWGTNAAGQLGTNNVIGYSSPVQTIAAGTNWKQVSLGETFTGAIKTDGTLWMWGNNTDGRLGDNTTTDRSSPVQTIAGGTNWKLISCGNYHTAAIKTDGTLWSWGTGAAGTLGDNTTAAKSSPVQTISGGTNWKSVEVGNYTTGAIKTDGTLWMWGQNVTYAALGDGSGINRSSPIQTLIGGNNWKQVSPTRLSTMAITFSDQQ